jgi:hypothetical protein
MSSEDCDQRGQASPAWNKLVSGSRLRLGPGALGSGERGDGREGSNVVDMLVSLIFHDERSHVWRVTVVSVVLDD